MEEKTEHEKNWESFIKMLLQGLDIPTKENISFLHTRLDKLEQLLYQKHLAKVKTGRKSEKRQRNASSIALEVIAKYPKGTDFKTIKSATGFDDKKVRNIIYRLDKLKKIKRVKRGIYKKI